LWIAGNSLRLARVCVEDAYQYATARRTFGQLLIDRQAIRSKFVNVGMQIMGAHALLESLAQIRDELAEKGRLSAGTEQFARIGGLCALTKVMSARAVELAVRECQQIMGALAYTRSGQGARVERISRDMRVLVIGGGSEEVMTDLSLLQEAKDVLYLSRLEL
jgi:alkylation response protein AidB-like acyl-CoA dehydrogenase